MSIAFGTGNKSQAKNLGPDQILFKKEEENLFFNLSKDRMVLSNIKAYAGWESLFNYFINFLDVVNDKLGVKEFNRVSVRYVNNLNLPNYGLADFNKYIKSAPSVPNGVPNKVSGFLNRLILSDEEKSTTAIVSQGLDHNRVSLSETLPVIFDIDVIKTGKLISEKENIENILNSLRKFKNDIFFNTLTNKCLELYE